MSSEIGLSGFGLEIYPLYIHYRHAELFEDKQRAEQKRGLILSIGESLEKAGHKIYWRRFPEIVENKPFEKDTTEWALTARLTIGPKE